MSNARRWTILMRVFRVATIVLVVVWLGSGSYTLICRGPMGMELGTSNGMLHFWKIARNWEQQERGRFAYYHRGWALKLWPDEWVAGTRPRRGMLNVPIWLIVLGAGLLCTRFEMLARNARRCSTTRVCFHCRYDRSGLAAAARCPECGRAPPAQSRAV